VLALVASSGLALAVAPTARAASTNSDPSGVPMPVGNLPGWQQVYAENFANVDYPVGSFTNCNGTRCAGTPGFPMGASPDGTPDTSGNCEYYPSQTVSVSGGLLNINLHTASDGVCMGANLFPAMPALTYEMYTVEFRADPVAGYKEVDFLWPVNGVTGEIDFPENHLDSTITGSLHVVAGGDPDYEFDTPVTSTGWNTATIEWTPTAVTYILNGTVVQTDTTNIPNTPMALMLRGESDLAPAPPPPASSNGNIQIDWVTAYSYAPATPVVSSVSPSTLGQGASNTNLLVQGPGFTPDATVSFSSPGITVDGPVDYIDGNELSVPVSVAPGASVGPSDVIVTESSGSGTCSACLNVEAGPGVTGASGDAVAGSTVPVTINGAGFQQGITVFTSLTGADVSAPTAVSANQVTVPVTVPAKALAGSYNLTVTNPDGGAASCQGCLEVQTAPGVPVIGNATAENGSASVAFSPPSSDGNATISSYTVTAIDRTDPASGGQTASGTGSPVTVTGLTDGDSYKFSVAATNSVGTGPSSADSTPVTPSSFPAAPVLGTATSGNAMAAVSFTPPPSDGGSPVTSYTVNAYDTTNNANGGQTQTGTRSPIKVSGLTNGDSYVFTVTAANVSGSGPASASSNAVTPSTDPLAPTIGTAVASNTQATVSFSPPSSSGGLPITCYTVTAHDSAYPANGGEIATGAASPVTITGLTDGNHYYFTVSASTASGKSPSSTASNTVTPATVPGPPLVVQTTSGNAKAVVAFDPPGSNGGSPIIGYTVTAYDTTNSSNGGQTATGRTSPITVTGLVNGDTYLFVVTASNAIGSSPASSASDSAVPTTLASAPAIEAATPGNAQATVSFSPPSANGGNPIEYYTVTANDTTNAANGGEVATGASSPVTVTGLTNGDRYKFSVTATTSEGTSPSSGASASVTPATVPSAPVMGTVTGGNARAKVEFSPPTTNGGSSITSYTATAYDVSDPAAAPLSQSSGSFPITVAGLSNGDSYIFTVSASNALGTGPASAASNSVTPGVPSAPVMGSATAGAGQATVTFSPPSTDGGTGGVSPITSYSVAAVDNTNPVNGGQTETGKRSPLTVTGLTDGDSYTFTVVATNAIGTGAASFASNPVVPVAAPGAPEIDLVSPAGGQATVTFDPPTSDGGSPVTGYTVAAVDTTNSSNGGQVVTGPASPLTVDGLTNGDTYTFTVTATNTAGIGPASAPSNGVVPATVPDPPVIGTVAAGDGNASVNFAVPDSDGGSAVTSYTVTAIDTTNPANGGEVATGSSSPLLVSGLTDGDTYVFAVTATNAVGTSQPSASSDPVTPIPASGGD
jgi:hypothetical protein